MEKVHLIKNKSFMNVTVLILTLIVGLGLALVLPWLVNIQSQAAEIEFDPDKESAPEVVPRYYVAKTGDGTVPGLGWSTAFTNVQDALAVAPVLGGEIWVAAGVYYPDEGIGQINNAVSSTFVLTGNVTLYGGFDTKDTKLSQRDWEKNVTVLSGDIDGDDVTNGNGVVSDPGDIKGNNAYHVVSGSGLSVTFNLDGFTITAGQANSEYPNDRGGGLYCYGSGSGNTCSPSLTNLIFSGNTADYGCAIYSDGTHNGTSSPNLRNVTFSGNTAVVSGGAMFNNGSSNGNSSPHLRDVTFSGNLADNGGAMFNNGYQGTSSPSLKNVTFSGNSADRDGGAMYNNGSSGGNSSPILSNVTFSGNSADNGGAMFNNGDKGISNPVVRNSILWNNQDNTGTDTIPASIINNSATTFLVHSLAQGTGGSSNWTSDSSYVNGGSNKDVDPMFITSIDPSNAPTTSGNLRLQPGSPAIDAGDNSFMTGVLTDLDGNPRFIDGNSDGIPTIDMGAYEYSHYSYLPLIYR